MNRYKWMPIILVASLMSGSSGLAQGFQNLDFENPRLPLVRDSWFEVPITDAMPGWRGYIGSGPVGGVGYDTISLEAAWISFHGPGSTAPSIRNRYRVFLQPGPGMDGMGYFDAAIAQTGTVPTTALSLRFYSAWGTPTVYFAGQLLPTRRMGAGPNGSELNGADISRFAGQSGELRFSGLGFLDAISFSPLAVPEPATLALLALGGALLGWLRGRTRR